MRVAAVLAALAVTAVFAAPTADAAPKNKLPVVWDLGHAIPRTFDASVSPPGANDWKCKPSREHPRPVVLVPPTGSTQGNAFFAGAPFLKNRGYCVFTFNHGNLTPIDQIPVQGLGDIRQSARTLARTVDRVRAATGVDKVDLVGHSQGGGILPDYYLKFLGGGNKVHTKVGISPSTGTTLNEIVFLRTLVPILGPAVYNGLAFVAPALIQQVYDSPLNQRTYGRNSTPPGVDVRSLPASVTYHSIITQYDEVVTPFTFQYYDGPNAYNVLLQDGCQADMSDHISSLYDKRAWLHVLNALDPANAEPVPCFHVAPFLGSAR